MINIYIGCALIGLITIYLIRLGIKIVKGANRQLSERLLELNDLDNESEEILKAKIDILLELPLKHIYIGEEPNRRQRAVIMHDDLMEILNKRRRKYAILMKEKNGKKSNKR